MQDPRTRDRCFVLDAGCLAVDTSRFASLQSVWVCKKISIFFCWGRNHARCPAAWFVHGETFRLGRHWAFALIEGLRGLMRASGEVAMLSNFGNFFNKNKDNFKQVLLACRISLRSPTSHLFALRISTYETERDCTDQRSWMFARGGGGGVLVRPRCRRHCMQVQRLRLASRGNSAWTPQRQTIFEKVTFVKWPSF